MKTTRMIRLLMAFSFTPLAWADQAIKPLLADDNSRPKRAKVLLLGDRISKGDAEAFQDRLEDRITVYLANKEDSPELSKDAWKQLRARSWDAVYLAFGKNAGEAEMSVLEGKLKEISPVVVRGKAEGPGMDEIALTEALLRNKEFLAGWPGSEKRDPSRLLATDGSLDHPEDLPMLPSETITVFRAEEGEWQFNLHSFIAHHDGRYWAIWSSGRKDEDSSSQFIRYATSKDGFTWSESGTMARDSDGEGGPQRWLASGLYVEGGVLYGLGCRNTGGGKNGVVWGGAALHRFRWGGKEWVDEGAFGNSMVYFPPLKVGGRDFFVWRDEKAHFLTARSTDQRGKWDVRRHPSFPPDYRMSETGSYLDDEGNIHLIIRDQGKTHRLYHSVSFDQGDTWTLPVKTNYPDAMSKNFAGKLKDGRYFLINNPRADGRRDPLTITFSRNGWTFGDPHVLRKDAMERRYPGKAKNNKSFQYSDAMEHDERLWVIYGTNKEDIEISSFRIEDLPK